MGLTNMMGGHGAQGASLFPAALALVLCLYQCVKTLIPKDGPLIVMRSPENGALPAGEVK